MAHPKAELVRKEYDQYEKRNDAGEPFPAVISDMIADLLHLGDALAESDPENAEDWQPEQVLGSAYGHYYAEGVEPDDIELSERATQDEEDVRGCSCGMADYGAPGHDHD